MVAKKTKVQRAPAAVLCIMVPAGASEGFKDFLASLANLKEFLVVILGKSEALARELRTVALQTLSPDEVVPMESATLHATMPLWLESRANTLITRRAPPENSTTDTRSQFAGVLASRFGSSLACVFFDSSDKTSETVTRELRENGAISILEECSEMSAATKAVASHTSESRFDFQVRGSQIAQFLIDYFEAENSNSAHEPEPTDVMGYAREMPKVLAAVKAVSTHDFSLYRKTTVIRRIERRRQMLQLPSVQDYREYLSENSEEATALFRDFLLVVTRFFRDPDFWTEIEEKFIPHLVENCRSDVLRLWVPGCASGEEAYTLAMLILEAIGRGKRSLKIQIFASDIHPVAISAVRSGKYPKSIEEDVSAERLSRFFTREGDGYRVKKQLRECVVVASHNILSDPPFLRMEMVCCRNLFIYLEHDAQKKALDSIYFSLVDNGILALGPSETVGARAGLFKQCSQHFHIYFRQKEESSRRSIPRLSLSSSPISIPLESGTRTERNRNLFEDVQRKLLQEFAPPAVVVNPKLQILYYSGNISDFLSRPNGIPTDDLLTQAKSSLRSTLSSTIRQAFEQEQPVLANTFLEEESEVQQICITVSPLARSAHRSESTALVVFQRIGRVAEASSVSRSLSEVDKFRIEELEYELRVTKEDLRAVIEQQIGTNEEMRAANEEITSANEELQSANEELETSKEELQILNQELRASETALQQKVRELEAANTDTLNFLTSSDVIALFLDDELCLRVATPNLQHFFGVEDQDKGSRLDSLVRKLEDVFLLTDANSALVHGVCVEREIRTHLGQWFQRKVTPYRQSDGRPNGVVVIYSDITPLRTISVNQFDQRNFLQESLRQSPMASLIFNRDGNLAYANRAANSLLGMSEIDIDALITPDERPQTLCQIVIPQILKRESVQRFNQQFIAGEGRVISLNLSASPIVHQTGEILGALCFLCEGSAERSVSVAAESVVQKSPFDLRSLLGEVHAVASLLFKHRHLELSSSVEQRVPKEVIGYPNCIREICMGMLSHIAENLTNGSVRLEAQVMHENGIHLKIRFGLRIFGPASTRVQIEKLLPTIRELPIDSLSGSRSCRLNDALKLIDGSMGLTALDEVEPCSLLWFSVGLQSEPPRTPTATAATWLCNIQKEISAFAKWSNDTLGRQPRVLIVDDDSISLGLMALMTQEIGCISEVASGGEQAVAVVQASDPDVVLIDLHMPGFDGFETADRVQSARKAAGKSEVTIVLVTANQKTDLGSRCTEQGIYGLLLKPLRIGELISAIRNSLNSSLKA